MSIGAKIRAARIEAKLTQEQLAGGDLAKSYISEIERDRRHPRLMTLTLLAHRLHKPLSHFVEGASEEAEIETYLGLAECRLYAGSPIDAQAFLERAAELALHHSAELLQARVELALAVADVETEAFARAQRRLDRCLPILTRYAATLSLAWAHYWAGKIRSALGDPGSALWAFQAGLQLLERAEPDRLLSASLQLGIAGAYRALGKRDAAREALQSALAAGDLGVGHASLSRFHLEVAGHLAAEGRLDRAREHTARAVGIAETTAQRRALARIHEELAGLAAEEARWDAAEEHYRWAAALHGAAADLPAAADTLCHLAEVLLARASPESARGICEAALAVLDTQPAGEPRGHALRVLAATYRLAGRTEEAKEALHQSLTVLQTGRDKEGIRLVHQELAILALEAGDVSDARRHLGALQKM